MNWSNRPLSEQLANVGSEVGRAISWRAKGRADFSSRAFYRSLDLLEATIADPKNRTAPRLKELTRLREVLVDFFSNNEYRTTADFLERYFLAFNFAARSTS